jgi:hypothetical protein
MQTTSTAGSLTAKLNETKSWAADPSASSLTAEFEEFASPGIDGKLLLTFWKQSSRNSRSGRPDCIISQRSPDVSGHKLSR